MNTDKKRIYSKMYLCLLNAQMADDMANFQQRMMWGLKQQGKPSEREQVA
jgi:hypothetical protein